MPSQLQPTTNDSPAFSATIAVPAMGWNNEDNISQMDPSYALDMENYFPAYGVCTLRNGYRKVVSGLGNGGGAANDIVTGIGSFGTNNMIASTSSSLANFKVYAINAGSFGSTDITGAEVLSSGQFTSLNFNGHFFFKPYNNSDHVYIWSGSGNIATSGFTGPSGSDVAFTNIATYKTRFYGAEGTNLWYGAPNGITGAMSSFPLASYFSLGGNIAIIGQISRAKNYQADSLFVAISNLGEVVIYQGDYPLSLSWTLVGHFYIPPPQNQNSSVARDGDLVIGTILGGVSLLSVLSGDSTYIQDSMLSAKITQPWIANQALGLSFDYSAQPVYYPGGNQLFFNLPTTQSGGVAVIWTQYVMNISTGAWCRFTNQNASCWTVFNNKPYFGGPYGKIFQADTGNFDEDPANTGQALTRSTTLRPAYNYFNDQTQVKQFVEAQPILYESNGLSVTLDSDVDYENRVSTSLNTDSSKGNAYQLYKPRCGLQGLGNAASIRFDGTCTTKQRSILAIKVYWNEGGR